jgi:hypothetical protein
MKWTKKDIEDCISFIKNGKNYSEIASITGREYNAIKVKMGKLGETFSKYNPPIKKNCLECGGEIKRFGKKFCSSSCSITHSNKLKGENKINVICLGCNKTFKSYKVEAKYCSKKCVSLYNKKIIYEKIENGDSSLFVRQYKKYLIAKHGEKCMECGWSEINQFTNKIPIELHHKDGDSDNNNIDNLILLCPNHHSLSKNWKGAIRGNGRYSKRRMKRRQNYKEGKSC